jgi:hypothetical protein
MPGARIETACDAAKNSKCDVGNHKKEDLEIERMILPSTSGQQDTEEDHNNKYRKNGTDCSPTYPYNV